jgi:hypothetical protein
LCTSSRRRSRVGRDVAKKVPDQPRARSRGHTSEACSESPSSNVRMQRPRRQFPASAVDRGNHITERTHVVVPRHIPELCFELLRSRSVQTKAVTIRSRTNVMVHDNRQHFIVLEYFGDTIIGLLLQVQSALDLAVGKRRIACPARQQNAFLHRNNVQQPHPRQVSGHQSESPQEWTGPVAVRGVHRAVPTVSALSTE